MVSQDLSLLHCPLAGNNRAYVLQVWHRKMHFRKHVFLFAPVDSNSGDASFVAKVMATPYPEQLHEELSRTGLAPKLMQPVQEYPGGMTLRLCANAYISFHSSKHGNNVIRLHFCCLQCVVAASQCNRCCNLRVVSYLVSKVLPLRFCNT